MSSERRNGYSQRTSVLSPLTAGSSGEMSEAQAEDRAIVWFGKKREIGKKKGNGTRRGGEGG